MYSHTLKINELSMKNFLSYGDKAQVVDLSEEKSILIIGDNRDLGDAEGESRNGCGKSSLFNGVLYALFGMGVETTLKADSMINFTNGKRLEVSLTFEHKGSLYKVTRKRKPTSLTLERLDPEPIDMTLDSMANTNEAITQLIGMDYEVFVMMFYLAPSKRSFMELSGAGQRDMIEKILSLDVLVKRAQTLKDVVGKEITAELKSLQTNLKYASELHEKRSEDYRNAVVRVEAFEKERASELTAIKEQIDAYTDFDPDQIQSLLSTYQIQMNAIASLEKDIQKKDTDMASCKSNLAVFSSRLEMLKDNLDAVITQEANQAQTLSELREELDNMPSEEELSEYETILTTFEGVESVKREIRQHQSTLAGLKETLERYVENNESIEQYETKRNDGIEKLKVRLTEYPTLEEIENHLAQVEKNNQAKARISELTGLTSRIEAELDGADGRLTDLEAFIEKLEAGQCPTCKQSHVDEALLASKQTEVDNLIDWSEAKVRLIEDNDKEIKDLTSTLVDTPTERELLDAKSKVVAINEKIDEYQNRENPFSFIDTQKLELQISETEKTISELSESLDAIGGEEPPMTRVAIRNTRNQIVRLESDIRACSTMDYASQIEELNQNISGAEKNWVEENNALTNVKKDREILSQNLSDTKTRIQPIEQELKSVIGGTTEADLANTEKTLEGLLDRLGALESKENPFIELRDSIELPDLKSLEEEVKKKETEQTHAQFLIRLLTDNKSFVRKNIVDTYTDYFNKRLLAYTQQLGLPHLVTLNNDLSVSIEFMGKENVPYHSLSAGERLRLNAASTGAFKDLIGTLGLGCNLLMVDEFVDGSLDPIGMRKSFEFLRETSKTLFLISHRPEFTTQVDGVTRIIKENGFSRIEK